MKEPIVNIAIRAARAAGDIIVRSLDRLDQIRITEKSSNNFVTEIDHQAEKEIIRVVRKAYPAHAILAEESGTMMGAPDNEWDWIIDPLDGTRNFMHGFPHFAVSIAIRHKSRIEHGVIYDPLRQELFTASRGKGAFLNQRRIRVANRKNFKECLLATGFSTQGSMESVTRQTKSLASLFPLTGDVRRAGAAVLDLAYVACGRLDGFWEKGLKPWDLAAGALLVREAGGLVCDFLGGENWLATGDIIAGNPKILTLLLQQLSSYLIPSVSEV